MQGLSYRSKVPQIENLGKYVILEFRTLRLNMADLRYQRLDSKVIRIVFLCRQGLQPFSLPRPLILYWLLTYPDDHEDSVT